MRNRSTRVATNSAMKTLHLLSRGLVGCAALFLSCEAWSQGGGGDTTPPQPTPPGYHEAGPGVTVREQVVSDKDRDFLEKAAKAGFKEVAVSRAVLARSTDPKTREFAQMTVTDHAATNQELTTLAKSKFVSLPAETDADKEADKWAQKSGNVDKAYLDEMISDHKEAVKLFEKGAKAEDADIAAFARKTLPKLKHHLEEAEALKKAK